MLAQTREQRFSVHHLTNLGGLVALAGLDLESPDLLGALPQMADVLANSSADQRPALASSDHKKLDQRATGKRAWKSWARVQELLSINLSAAQFRKLIEALGGHPPDNSASLDQPHSDLRVIVDWAFSVHHSDNLPPDSGSGTGCRSRCRRSVVVSPIETHTVRGRIRNHLK
jgi:Conjugal transfer protein TraD